MLASERWSVPSTSVGGDCERLRFDLHGATSSHSLPLRLRTVRWRGGSASRWEMTLTGGWSMSSRYVLVTSGDQFLFNLKAGNNEKILTSERYTSRASALGGIAAVRANAADDERYDL